MGEVVVSSEGGGMDVETEEEEEKEEKMENEKNEGGDGSGSSDMVMLEKFLPRMELRVLLVEADDSTRQIIAALLRKCGYRVAAVSDGLMAWETLKGRPNDIDIILTEVELPSISGYALLTLVMEDDACRNIPVIMMSSHDSISMVLKCMLKGAADFLIKPVRRNELKNLWQHVWRRQTTAGHIPQNSPISQNKVDATSENIGASNHSSDATSAQKNKECSEEGSDVQGLSHVKCRTINLSNADRKNCEECVRSEKTSVTPTSKGSSNRVGPESSPFDGAYDRTALRLVEEHDSAEMVIADEGRRLKNDRVKANIYHAHGSELVETSAEAIDLIGTFDSGLKHTYGDSSLNDGSNKFEFSPQLELSLRRFYPSVSKGLGTDERHALNHSNASAFSRYNSKTVQPFFLKSTSNGTQYKEDGGKSTELSSSQVLQSNSCTSQRHCVTLGDGKEIGQAQQAERAYARPQLGLVSIPGIRLDSMSTGYSPVFPPVCHTQSSGLSQTWSPKLGGQRGQSPFPSSTSVHCNPEIQDSEQKRRQSAETSTNSTIDNVHQQNNREGKEHLVQSPPATGQSTSGGICNGVMNDDSAYGSASSKDDGYAALAMGAEKATAPDSLNDGDLFIHGRLRGLDSHRFSQREAALTKFRLKRKDRCYEKKVRYQSRKRLAEQRPRVKGQFVRQVQHDAQAADTYCG